MTFDLEYDFNLAECALWLCCGAVMLAKTVRANGKIRAIFVEISAAFALFAASDFIEAHTGAWWTPWWLLAWKVANALWLASGFLRYYKLPKPAVRA